MSESRIVAVDVDAVDRLGEFGGTPYQRVRGTVHGLLAPDEDIVGIDLLPMDADGCFAWRAEFEVLRGADGAVPSVTVVDSENRGGPSMLGLVTGVQLRQGAPSTVEYPEGMGEGCLFDHRVVVRAGPVADRACRRGAGAARKASASPSCATSGDSSRARTATSERTRRRRPPRAVHPHGREPVGMVREHVRGRGVQRGSRRGRAGLSPGAFPYLSAGNWLAINRLADDGLAQDPYVRPDGIPLTAARTADPTAVGPVPRRRCRATPSTTACGRVCSRRRRFPSAPAGTTFRHRTHPGHRRSRPPRSRCSVATAGSRCR